MRVWLIEDDGLDAGQHVRYKVDLVVSLGVAAIRDFVVRGAVDVMEDGARQPRTREFAKVLEIMAMLETHGVLRWWPSGNLQRVRDPATGEHAALVVALMDFSDLLSAHIPSGVETYLANFDDLRLRMWRRMGVAFDVVGTSDITDDLGQFRVFGLPQGDGHGLA